MLPGRLAWIGLGFVLAGLAVFALAVVITSHAAGNAVRTASVASDAYEQAAYAITVEESLERKYRLEPGPEVRANYAGRRPHPSCSAHRTRRRAAGSPEDARLVTEILEPSRRVPASRSIALFAAVDARRPRTRPADRHHRDRTGLLSDRGHSSRTAADESSRSGASTELDVLGRTDTFILVATPGRLPRRVRPPVAVPGGIPRLRAPPRRPRAARTRAGPYRRRTLPVAWSRTQRTPSSSLDRSGRHHLGAARRSSGIGMSCASAVEGQELDRFHPSPTTSLRR